MREGEYEGGEGGEYKRERGDRRKSNKRRNRVILPIGDRTEEEEEEEEEVEEGSCSDSQVLSMSCG